MKSATKKLKLLLTKDEIGDFVPGSLLINNEPLKVQFRVKRLAGNAEKIILKYDKQEYKSFKNKIIFNQIVQKDQESENNFINLKDITSNPKTVLSEHGNELKITLKKDLVFSIIMNENDLNKLNLHILALEIIKITLLPV